MRARFNRFVERHEVAWELAMGALAIAYVVVGFAADDARGQVQARLQLADLALTGVFAAEFALRFGAAFDRAAYLRGHWIDLVALIPTVRQFRVLRLLRLLRLIRTFSAIYRALLHVERLLGNRQIAAIAVIWLAVLLLTSFGLYIAERGVNAAVTSPLGALWWGVVTMTTVGYGDIYPMTPEGRLAATVLMVLGIALFGVITATATSLLMRTSDEVDPERPAADDPVQRIRGLFELLTLGAITTDEYRDKKVELLARI